MTTPATPEAPRCWTCRPDLDDLRPGPCYCWWLRERALGTGWTHSREGSCLRPEPRPFGELLRAGICRYCHQPIDATD